MKCKCCGQETQARIATPTDPSRSDWIGQDVSYCEYCGEFIYKLDEDQDWLHLKTDARKCGSDAQAV